MRFHDLDSCFGNNKSNVYLKTRNWVAGRGQAEARNLCTIYDRCDNVFTYVLPPCSRLVTTADSLTLTTVIFCYMFAQVHKIKEAKMT